MAIRFLLETNIAGTVWTLAGFASAARLVPRREYVLGLVGLVPGLAAPAVGD